MNDSRANERLGGKLSRDKTLVLAIIIGLVFLIAFPVVDWRIAIRSEAGGYYAVWNEDRSRFFISATDEILVVSRDGDQLAVEATIFHGLGKGPMGYHRGWLYFVGDNSDLLAINVSDLNRIETRGPIYLGAAAGAGIRVRSILAEDGISLFAGRYVEPSSAGVVLALDVTDPSSITNESSLRVAYKLDFSSLVTDVLIHDSILYVLEADGHLHSLNRQVVPPANLSDDDFPGNLVDMDMLGPLVALVDAGTNQSVLLYDHSTSPPVLLSEVRLPGRPMKVTLDGTRAFVSWSPDNFVRHGIAIYDILQPDSPKTLALFPLEDFGDSHIEDNGIVYAIGHHELAVIREQIVPFIATPTGLLASVVAFPVAFGYMLFHRLRRSKRTISIRLSP